MTNDSQSRGKAARDAEKARRLAEALRANLARRKTRRRSIAAADSAGAEIGDEGALAARAGGADGRAEGAGDAADAGRDGLGAGDTEARGGGAGDGVAQSDDARDAAVDRKTG